MGCGLRKMKPTSEEKSPGKIYSTLKRPQVETKVGVAYTYRYLDFLIGKDGGTSTLRLSSVRELPGQLAELYQQGFVLAAIHPFIHPCGPESNSPQHQLYRAILVQLSDGADRRQPALPPCKLQLEKCLAAEQVPTPELIQGYVKKQIQDAADQGVMFVGFIQEPYGAPCTRIREPETPSLSLHSSPSSVLGSLGSCSPSDPSSPALHAEPVTPEDSSGLERSEDKVPGNAGNHSGSRDELSAALSLISEELTEEESPCHNNNQDNGPEMKQRLRYLQKASGVELLALYNHPAVREGPTKYYTVKVPLKVQTCDEGMKEVEANWLDHMTQHFNNGASLVDGHFHLGGLNDALPKSVDSVFVFQEASDSEVSAIYDAIVVEQWTIIDGLQVKADYIPLLQSLAMFGWRLTCVLPTPVIKTNSDGSLATKQIVFLQRPVLGRKQRESKKLIFKPRGKSNKNGIKDTAKNKKTKTMDKNVDSPKIPDRRDKAGNEEDNERKGSITRKGEKPKQQDEQIEDVSDVHAEPVHRREDMAETEDRGAEEETGDTVKSELHPELLEETDVLEVTETAATVPTKPKTSDNKEAEVEAVVENGVEKDEGNEKDKDPEKSQTVEVTIKDSVMDSPTTTMNEISQE
ncbi:raftlin-like [Dunckerocampus dactyliophorus]|uniref:raftlin-like n=1 Tax=Dunckerocampus dactyliophorus TaxID=161453 RepID=UPI00240713B8|nr:raftlin-like [Dunckerocampus dactyliophorus]XP_054636921.1 raftlin-like [Dunckerocampus dactyliophorus]